MKKILKISIVLLIIATATFTIQHFLFSNASSEAGVLISSKVTKDTLSTTISCTGNLEPVDEVEVGTQVSGDINKLFVDYNSTVKKGQILAMLDKSKLQSAVYQAKIAYASAKNDYEYDTSVYNRTKKLAETNSASTSELEKAKYDMEAAKLNVEKSKSDVSQAQLDLSYCNIKSPIDGIVLERDVDVGQTVSASTSAPTLFILARDLTQMQLLAAVDEADIGSVKKGQRVSFTVDAFLNDLFTGIVKEVRLNPTTTSNVVTYTVVITANNPDMKLLPGMTATCTIVTKEITDAICVPVKALKFTPAAGTPTLKPEDMPKSEKQHRPDFKNTPPKQLKQKFVWVNFNGKVAPRPVETGISDDVKIQILHGLSVGDSVIISQEKQTTTKKSSTKEVTSPFMPSTPKGGGPRRR